MSQGPVYQSLFLSTLPHFCLRTTLWRENCLICTLQMQKPEQLSDLPKVTELVSGGVMTQAQTIQGLCHAVLSGTNPVSFTLQSRTPQLKVSHLPHILRPGRGSQPPLQTEDLNLGTPWLLLPASVLLGKLAHL